MTQVFIVSVTWMIINLISYILYRDNEGISMKYNLAMQWWLMFLTGCWWFKEVMG